MTGTVLLVDPDPETCSRLVGLLQQAGFQCRSAAAFEDARRMLTVEWPDLLITQVRLGAFNGLHLVIVGRARRPAMAAIVIGTKDPMLEKEAQRQGATYFDHPVTDAELVEEVRRKLEPAKRQRRWPRTPLAGRLDAEVDHSLAKIIDLSYGGLRLEIEHAEVPSALPRSFRVSVPAFGLSITTAPVWMNRTPSGSVWCGAVLAEPDRQAATAWRQLVDSLTF